VVGKRQIRDISVNKTEWRKSHFMVNNGITEGEGIRLQFRDCKKFLIDWINRQDLVYGCQMYLYDEDVLKALKGRNCLITVAEEKWMRCPVNEIQSSPQKRYRNTIENYFL